MIGRSGFLVHFRFRAEPRLHASYLHIVYSAYTTMLSLHHDPETGALRLVIRNPFAAAWISPYRRLTPDFRHVREVHDWRLWVQRVPDLPPKAGKSPTGLLVESRLRAWLLQRLRRRLRDLRFEELRRIAESRSPDAFSIPARGVGSTPSCPGENGEGPRRGRPRAGPWLGAFGRLPT